MNNLIIFISLSFSIQLFASASDESCQIMENKIKEMNIISSNIANFNTTRTPEGGAYRRKEFVCENQICKVLEESKFVLKYQPGHPDSDEDGYVNFPDIDLLNEMDIMIQVAREYDQVKKFCN